MASTMSLDLTPALSAGPPGAGVTTYTAVKYEQTVHVIPNHFCTSDFLDHQTIC